MKNCLLQRTFQRFDEKIANIGFYSKLKRKTLNSGTVFHKPKSNPEAEILKIIKNVRQDLTESIVAISCDLDS